MAGSQPVTSSAEVMAPSTRTMRIDQPAAAEALFQRALSIRRESLPPGHYFIALAELAYAEFLLAAGRRSEAQALLGHALSALTEAWGPQHPRTLEVAQVVVHAEAAP